MNNGEDKNRVVKFLIKLPHNLSKEIIINDILKIEGVEKVSEE